MKVFKVFIILVFFIGFSKAFSSKDCEEAFLSSNNLSQNLSSNSSSINLSSSVKEQASFKPSGFYKSIKGLFRFLSQSFNNNQKPIKPVKPSNPKELSQLITQGALLSKGQELEFNYHLTKTFNSQNLTKGLTDVLATLDKHPGQLNKLQVKTQHITFFIKQKKAPESLTHFLKSFRSRANKTKRFFQISPNWGLWAHLLMFKAQDFKQGLSKQQRREAFFEYLNSSPLAQNIHDFIIVNRLYSLLIFTEAYGQHTVKQFIENPSTYYRDKTIVLYKVLDIFREQAIKQGREDIFEKLSLLMAELIHVVGLNNPFWLKELKDKDPLQVIKAIRDILTERDSLAMDLGFTDTHYQGLKNSLLDSFQSPQVKSVKKELSIVEDQVIGILKDLKNQPIVATYSETFTLRPLSLQESPFRGCLGKDCSTSTYFLKALDPAYLYFTLTDSEFVSHGQITVVLGMSKNQNGKTVKTAFVDKIQDIPNHRIIPMLEGIRISLTEQGYKLALPKNVGDDNGLSNSSLTSDFARNNILPDLKNVLKNFKPKKTPFFITNEEGHSRANMNLKLLEFKTAKKDFKIQQGEVFKPKVIDKSWTIKSWFLSAIQSKKEEDQFLIIANLMELVSLNILPYSKALDYLKLKIQNKFLSFELRKQALFSVIQLKSWLWDQSEIKSKLQKFKLIESLMLEFSNKELNTLIGEMSNWKNTNEGSRKNFVIILSELFSPELISLVTHSLIPGLFEHVVDLNIKKGVKRQTALHRAVEVGDKDIVKLLLDRGVFLDIKDTYEKTPLHYATKYGYQDIAKLLLKAGASPNLTDHNGYTAFEYVIKQGHKDIVKLLFEAGADPNLTDHIGQSLFREVIKQGDKSIIKLFIDSGVNIQGKDEYVMLILRDVILSGDKDIINLFLKNKANIDILFYYSIRYNQELVEYLLKQKGLNPNKRYDFGDFVDAGGTFLYRAIIYGSQNTIKLLLEHGADPNTQIAKNHTAFNQAIYQRDTNTVKLLLAYKANPEIKNEYGKTALHQAIDTKNQDIIKALLEHGAQPNLKDNKGQTALHTAIVNGSKNTVKLILDYGAKPNLKDNKGRTALHLSVDMGLIYIVKLLLEYGVDLNLQDNKGRTALHKAIDIDYIYIVKLLLEYGAKPNIKDNKGHTPLDYALINKQAESISLLQTEKIK